MTLHILVYILCFQHLHKPHTFVLKLMLLVKRSPKCPPSNHHRMETKVMDLLLGCNVAQLKWLVCNVPCKCGCFPMSLK